MTEELQDQKLDGDLLELISSGVVRETEQVPVVIRTAAGDASFERVVEMVSRVGRIRHVLSPLNAVSAWLSLSAIQDLAKLSMVTAIQFPEPVQIAS